MSAAGIVHCLSLIRSASLLEVVICRAERALFRLLHSAPHTFVWYKDITQSLIFLNAYSNHYTALPSLEIRLSIKYLNKYVLAVKSETL